MAPDGGASAVQAGLETDPLTGAFQRFFETRKRSIYLLCGMFFTPPVPASLENTLLSVTDITELLMQIEDASALPHA